jgi:hypothetical protein
LLDESADSLFFVERTGGFPPKHRPDVLAGNVPDEIPLMMGIPNQGFMGAQAVGRRTFIETAHRP